MSPIVRIAATVGIFAALLGVAQPASADVTLRDSTVSDLYNRADVPSLRQVEKQFAAFWNPNIAIAPKLDVSYNGAKARPALERVMQNSKTMDFFSIQGRAIGPVRITGNAMAVTLHGLMAGFPAQTTNYHFIREDGLWKFDWKRTCQEMQCAGNPSFGY